MANLNLNQDVTKKEKENKQLLMMWPNLISYSKLQECVATGLLLTSTLWVQIPETEEKRTQKIKESYYLYVRDEPVDCHY